ncbi:DUF1998 domain-containing protein [Paenibacillus sp. WQ 127069]|uniref:DUF1998 domain-containing protein n=1 Tax=Paenibacillus baimaensis TaxID=2982185 RepID=A0ABT2UCV1_9BACL|nr:DUF1998 domain-containing protein [Paenibacillus sp. WQ 127069]MCU6792465.1 DUF1998 domain-containing protein [Paenibacillus sp. WQ 127069]
MAELKQQRDILDLNKITHSVRSAQAILQYGVGAMVDFPDQTLMTAAPEYWGARVIQIHDERLEKALEVDYFGLPGGDEYHWGIAYTRFPQWYFCPKCRRFEPLTQWVKEYKNKASQKQKERDPYMKRPRCMECKQSLVPTRIVIACEKGHVDDFPWVNWAHHNSFVGTKSICSNPRMLFKTGATASAGLEGLVIECSNCKAKATLSNAFNKDAMEKMEKKHKGSYECTGNMPWKNKQVDCGTFPRAMQRGASSIYFPKIVSSLVIPPYSDKINAQIEQSKVYKDCLVFIAQFEGEEIDHLIKARLDKWSKDMALEIYADVNVINHIITRRLLNKEDGATNIEANSMQYRIEEYEALTGRITSNDLDGNDFLREETDIQKYDIPYLKSVSLIHKIREVRALTGFTRINPPDSQQSGEQIPGFISIKEQETRWYPAYEVRGEGIFFEFDNKEIDQWVRQYPQVNHRADILNHNFEKSYQGSVTTRQITPKYVLLHTISHLLIRQLSFECGYTAASLRERIYCDIDNNEYEMSGILIYTASGDSEGTLGGLVRQGYWDCLPRTFKKAMQYAELCSNDPVCISSVGQGREALNLAACHTCGLLPETSCEDFNVFLDRALVIGTFENKEIGFYNDWLLK